MLVALLGATPPRAHASGTDPVLVLTAVEAFGTASGPVGLEVHGSFHVEDYVQFPFPVGLLVWRGTEWARYELGGSVFEGNDPALAGGVTSAEMLALVSSGTSAPPPARAIRTEPGRLQIALPAQLTPGSVSVVAYAVLEGNAFLSNVLTAVAP